MELLPRLPPPPHGTFLLLLSRLILSPSTFFNPACSEALLVKGSVLSGNLPTAPPPFLKVQPTDTWGPVGTSQLRGRSDTCLLIDMHASLHSGTQWIQHASDGCYGTDQVSLTPPVLVSSIPLLFLGDRTLLVCHNGGSAGPHFKGPCYLPSAHGHSRSRPDGHSRRYAP